METKPDAVFERLKSRMRVRLMRLLEADASNSHGADHRPDRAALQHELQQLMAQLLEDAPDTRVSPQEQERIVT